MRELPHLVYLQAFEAAARHLSFTQAAAELNCTQAAISQRVRGLEQYFGRPLFQRLPAGLELSSAGKAYLPGITQALDMAEAATRGLTGRRVQRSVTLSAPVSFLGCWLSPRLAGFHAAHPDTGVRLTSSIWTDPTIDLADLSVEMREEGTLPADAVPLARQDLCLVATPGTAAALAAGRPLDACRPIEMQGKYRFWEMWAEGRGIALAPDHPAIRVDNALVALDLVAENAGVAVVYSCYAERMLADGRLSAPFEPVPVPHVLTLVRNRDRGRTPAATAFANWLSGEFPSVE